MSEEPQPMAPGEKIALRLTPANGVEVLRYPDIQMHILRRYARKHLDTQEMQALQLGSVLPVNGDAPNWGGTGANGYSSYSFSNGNHYGNNGNGQQTTPAEVPVQVASARALDQQFAAAQAPEAVAVAEQAAAEVEVVEVVEPQTEEGFAELLPWHEHDLNVNTAMMSGLGWERYHVGLIETIAQTGKEMIGSLGWDGPLAAMSQTRTNLADYFKETVAVVTNPAIDREREQAQFSTRTLLGNRPAVGRYEDEGRFIDLASPLLIGGHPDLILPEETIEALRGRGIWTLEAVADYFGANCVILPACASAGESLPVALERLQGEAVDAVLNG
ncbi:MAG: hypothetical protein KC496_10800, partial [Anaerolineae bacterium]|nr:hypothetical protein [Anaerolineae bacterium]